MAKNGVNPEDLRRLKAKLSGLPPVLFKHMKKGMEKHGQWWLGRMFERFRAPLPVFGQPNNNTTLHNRTNSLRNSLKHRVRGSSLKSLSLHLSSASPYARMQEFGGEIRPKRAKFLAIPIDDALFPAGGTRPEFLSPRKVKDTRVLTGKRTGNRYIVKDVGGDTKFLYALRKRVVIPGPKAPGGGESRLGMIETATNARARKKLRIRLAQTMKRGLQEVFHGSP